MEVVAGLFSGRIPGMVSDIVGNSERSLEESTRRWVDPENDIVHGMTDGMMGKRDEEEMLTLRPQISYPQLGTTRHVQRLP